MENQLLHTPIEDLGYVELVFRRAGHLMHPTKLLELTAGSPQHPDYLAIER
jgi:hypothetical protein